MAKEDLVPFGTRIPKDLHQSLRMEAARSCRSIAELTAEALTALLKKKRGAK